MTTLDGQWVYAYDAVGELAQAVFASNNPSTVPNQNLQYVYDPAGNRVSTTINGVTTQYVTNNLNEYTSIDNETLTYDKRGNLISETDSSGTSTFTYDALDRMVSATTSGGDTSTYQYDALGSLIATTENGQTTNYLIYPAGLGNLVAEYGGTGALIAHYVYGLGLTSRVDSTGGQVFYDFDALGSTVGISGGSGSYINVYRYLPFGQTSATEKIANPFQYVGQRRFSTRLPHSLWRIRP
jgi:YD repeat-containing protein